MQQNISDTERDAIFERLKVNPDNNKCFDCEKKNPKWSSVYLGIYLCLDCAGKHREYGPQISFARSLNLDTWNRRYITFMEQGGNTKALEYFKKQGLKAPYDYKNPSIQKYKQELTKKVDAVLASNNSAQEEAKPITVAKAEEEKPKKEIYNLQPHSLTVKSFSDKPRHGESSSDDPFANNIIINKGETKTKGFTVEFSKNKSAFGANKGRIAAKKIDNIDLDSLSLNEDASSQKANSKFDMAESAFGMAGKSNVKEIYAKTNEPFSAGATNNDKLKQFQNAKAISSDAFRTDYKNADASNVRKFRNASAISSAQYFGENEEEQQEDELYETVENVRDFISQVGGKLKEKADVFVNKMRDEWDG